MAELQKIIKWDPECLAGPRDCCDKPVEDDVLVAGLSDVWVLPLQTSTSYDLYDCEGNLIQAGFGTYTTNIKSSFVFKVTGLCAAAEPEGCEENPCQDDCGCEGVSAFRFSARHIDDADECSEVYTCESAIFHTGSDTVFLDGIVTMLAPYFDAVSRVGNEITVEWDKTDPDWRCRSILTSRTDFSSDETDCENYIDGDCLLQNVYNYTGNRCESVKRNEQMQLQGANLCIEIVQPKYCVDPDPLVKFDFSGVPIGKYYIQSDYGCSQIINVGDVCDTVFVYARNFDQQLKQFRLRGILFAPQFSKKQEVVYQPDGRMRKIYAELEKEWQFNVGEFRASVHYDLATLLESDYLAIEAYFDNSYFMLTREMIHTGNYEINWDEASGGRRIATAETKLKEVAAAVVNNFC